MGLTCCGDPADDGRGNVENSMDYGLDNGKADCDTCAYRAVHGKLPICICGWATREFASQTVASSCPSLYDSTGARASEEQVGVVTTTGCGCGSERACGSNYGEIEPMEPMIMSVGNPRAEALELAVAFADRRTTLTGHDVVNLAGQFLKFLEEDD